MQVFFFATLENVYISIKRERENDLLAQVLF